MDEKTGKKMDRALKTASPEEKGAKGTPRKKAGRPSGQALPLAKVKDCGCGCGGDL